MDCQLTSILDTFNEVVDNEDNFLSVNEEVRRKLSRLVKNVYDLTKELYAERRPYEKSVLKLLIEDGDVEQIWQQIELQNSEFLDHKKIESIENLMKDKSSFILVNSNENDNSSQSSDEEYNENPTNEVSANEGEDKNVASENDVSNEESMIEGDSEEDYEMSEEEKSNSEAEAESPQEFKGKKSIVDDKFFKLDEMENFLNTEEKKMNQDNSKKRIQDESSEEDEEINFFEPENFDEDVEESESLNPRFKDFFKRQEENIKMKRNKFLENDDDFNLEDNKDDSNKSKFEVREDRLQKKIHEIEKKSCIDKPWTMKGEITADKRPKNSLLEEVVEFDLAVRPAPIISEDVAQRLEDIILQRIKDKAYDDVERKLKPVETPLEFKKKIVLDQEKSKESLAHIYEKEYLQQKEAALNSVTEHNEKEPKLYKEIRNLRQKLFIQLDSLSNFHFTPKLPVPELKIVTNLPAISIEEVTPAAVSDAALLAPEEVKKKLKGELVSKEERSKTDKNRERRRKKIKQKIHAKKKAKKELLTQGKTKGKKVEKSSDTKQMKSSSRTFFDQLEEKVKNHADIDQKVKIKKNNKRRKLH